MKEIQIKKKQREKKEEKKIITPRCSVDPDGGMYKVLGALPKFHEGTFL